MTLTELLTAVAKAGASPGKLRVILLQGNPRQLYRQIETLAAMTRPEHKTENIEGRVN